MNIKKSIVLASILVVSLISCGPDDEDDNGIVALPERDRQEQQDKDDEMLQDYLRTHFYTLEENPANPNIQVMRFDTIAGVNSNQPSIWDSPLRKSKTVKLEDDEGNIIDYKIYVLDLRTGAGVAGQKSQPARADSTLVTYRGELIYDGEDADGDGIPDEADVDADGDGEPDVVSDVTLLDTDGDGITDSADVDADGDGQVDIDEVDQGPNQPPLLVPRVDTDGDGVIDEKDPVDNLDLDRRVFDSAVTPVWFDLSGLIRGFTEATIDYQSASSVTMNPDDGTFVSSDDFGQFTVFIPSGLAYYSSSAPGGGVPLYSSLIFNVQLYVVNEADHDDDGIPSYLEDLDTDPNDLGFGLVRDDDTDENGFPNYLDGDDDGDGTLTEDEITVLGDLNNDGSITADEITFYDDDGDGTPNHLDPDDEENKND